MARLKPIFHIALFTSRPAAGSSDKLYKFYTVLVFKIRGGYFISAMDLNVIMYSKL